MRFGKMVWAGSMISALVWAPAFAQTGPSNDSAPATTPAAAPAAAPVDSVVPAEASPPAPAASSSATPAAPANGAQPAPAPVAMSGSTYAVRLRDLEQRIDELKEQIRRSHTRLSLLTDTILSGGIAGSRADVNFQNEMGAAFRLTKAVFILDGAVQYNQSDDTGLLGDQREIPIFNGSIPPGDHTVQVHLQLQGSGYGVFSYMRGYQFEVKSSHSFTAIEGKTTSLQILAYEKGGSTTAHEERPAVRYIEKVTSGVTGGAAASASGTAADLAVGTGGR